MFMSTHIHLHISTIDKTENTSTNFPTRSVVSLTLPELWDVCILNCILNWCSTQSSKVEENSRSGESQETSEAENATEEGGVKEERKNGGFLRNMVRRMRGKGSAVGGDMRCLLMELEALGMSIGETC